MNIQAHSSNLHHASSIHSLLRSTSDGLSAHALSRAVGLEEVEVYGILVWLYDHDLARPQIAFHKNHAVVTSWSAMCSAETFNKLKPQVAWCWASGLIEIGDQMPADGPSGEGAIFIAKGPNVELSRQLAHVARPGQGKSAGLLLVPGVPEAEDQQAKADALAAWLDWCGRRRIDANSVVFSRAEVARA